ncbi:MULTISPECIES: helix-turn-helix domain-containing protein [Stutzerimonas stutzeri subgroup]|jgi:predicted DNA-binding transcriptional regulator AlpA|uniref:DNA-binding protein n=1 Tax=Stutzerimonas stutzeri TaxID=316 RepID=A0A2N8RH77_STUST|nr:MULTISPECIES: helix-turn-helix domain-containing protein [Stutzerimonas stutzeri subgroup]MCQ4253354.1 helix-turn-helix domain-containing protein [Stutzerimonas stutzeri]MDH0122280.1 helix-turn-helix domain-containing protein [Stutzerimonas stutzeri]PNF60437.1 DNA-binding protein [Stutzerimonas stutzeri]RSH68230.1 DNA-binding protein [Stutzerimonas stutzeri]|tara:strand:+ start:201 stop:461 length:261 start_codon:yes stop_codon:yes gene_type:complete
MHTTIEAIKADIAAALGYDPKNPPVQVDDKQAAAALGIKASTLSVWRSTGRYNLPYMKVGRLVRYRLSDLAEFLARRTSEHTGEAA